ncbi:MAG: peptidoglycan DD-metalloendopeptidase family protein [candidate division Zixibacteria bacterium]|nr:peptidoglycan DD-metalloendopeptidase family protein [candidate division Zixibacteria bacterium]
MNARVLRIALLLSLLLSGSVFPGDDSKDITNAISKYDERMASDRKVLRRLTGELDQLKADFARGDSLLQANRELFDRCQRRYLGNIRQFYTLSRQTGELLTDHPNDELEYHRRIIYLTALADFESGTIRDASAQVDRSATDLADMSNRRQTISGLKKERETSYSLGQSQRERQEKNLVQLRRKSTVEADHVITLKQAAQEMQEIVARLEEARARRAPETNRRGPSVFATLMGQLLSPYHGKITEAFGEHVDPVNRLKSFSPGITIKGKAHTPVYAVASGTVAYNGNLRGYGNFVIISHDDQYYSTYAGLGEVLVSENQFVSSREKLGSSGQDGVVKFELRDGREALDPVKWIDLESL